MRRTIARSSLIVMLALGGCGTAEHTEPLCPEGTYYEYDDGECEDTLEDALDLESGSKPKPKPKATAKPAIKPTPKPAPKPSKPRW